jgi:hypothetical protein
MLDATVVAKLLQMLARTPWASILAWSRLEPGTVMDGTLGLLGASIRRPSAYILGAIRQFFESGE